MWLSHAQVARMVLTFSLGMCVVGCGETSEAPAATAGSTGRGGGSSLQGGTGATQTGGSSGSAAGGADHAGAPSDGGAGQGTLAGAGGAPAGGSPGDWSCSLVHHVEVPFVASGASVVKSGVEFAISDGTTLVAWTWSGELARQRFERTICPNCDDGLFGLTPLRAPAEWRLLSINRGAQAAAARAWRMSDPSLPEPQPLFGPEFSGLVSTFSTRPSQDGTRAVFANGHRLVTREVTFAALDADGRMVAPASTLEVPFSLWDDLTVVPTEHAGAISVIAESDDHQQRVWLLRELDSSGQLVFASEVPLSADDRCAIGTTGGCAVVADADGYYLALVSTTGQTRIAQLLRDRPNELVIDEELVPPGALVGSLAGMLLFLKGELTATSLQVSFVGLPKSGAAEPRTLAVLPALDRNLNPKIQLIAVEGNSLFYGFQNGDKQVIEEVSCPE